jgi:hypothetical protein
LLTEHCNPLIVGDLAVLSDSPIGHRTVSAILASGFLKAFVSHVSLLAAIELIISGLAPKGKSFYCLLALSYSA